MWKNFSALLLGVPLLIGAFSSSSTYQLQSYGINGAASNNGVSATYQLEGASGQLVSIDTNSTTYKVKPGSLQAQQANVPPARWPAWLATRPAQGIPATIRRQAAFTLLYPVPSQMVVIPQPATIQYDPANHGVSYQVRVAGKSVTLSMQAVPDVFNDGPVYDLKLHQAHEYKDFDTASGHVSLTRPDSVSGTVAMENSRGTLLFAHAPVDLTDSEWQQLFNSLEIAP